MSIERQKLIEDLKLFSVKKGEEFVLSSGQISDVYVDVKQTMLYGPAMHNLAKLLYELSKSFAWYPYAVAGVPYGGSILATMVAMYHPPMNVILVRQEVKDHGTQKLVEAPPMNDRGKKVMLFEDVITTGKSVLHAVKILEDEGFDIRAIVAVVDRRTEKGSFFGGYPFIALVDFEELI